MVQEPIAKIQDLIGEFKIVKNKSRQKYLSELIGACIRGRSVVFSELAEHIDRDAKRESIERRIQDFFQKVEFDYKALLSLLICFVPHEKMVLSIDRTEWDRGAHQYNILCIVASIGKMAIPLYFELLDNKSGNSNYKNRISVLEQLVKKLGKSRIDFLVMDREFIGHEWLRWLKDNEIKFCVRVPKHHKVNTLEGDKLNAEALWLANKKAGISIKNAVVDGVVVDISITTGADGKLLYLIGNITNMTLKKAYKKRWGIEVFFQATKGRGFNTEKTGLRSNTKLRKLFAIVSIAYAICWTLGALKGKTKPVKVKKHGYPQYSIFRRGLNLMRDYLKRGIGNLINQTYLLVTIRVKIVI